MKVDFDEDPAFAAAVAAGVERALQNPAVLDALAVRITPAIVWLKYEEARGIVGVSESKFDRWIATHREPGTDGCPPLRISTGLGGKEPRVRLDSVLAVMDFHTPAEPPLNGAQLLGPRR